MRKVSVREVWWPAECHTIGKWHTTCQYQHLSQDCCVGQPCNVGCGSHFFLEGPVLFICILNLARVPGTQKMRDTVSVKKGSHNYTCGHSYSQRWGRASEFAGDEAYGYWGPLYKIAPGSASPCLGGALCSVSYLVIQGLCCIVENQLTGSFTRILFLPLLSIPSNGKGILEFLWVWCRKLMGTIVCIDSLKWIYPEEHDMVVSAFQERSQLHGSQASVFSSVHPKSFVQ